MREVRSLRTELADHQDSGRDRSEAEESLGSDSYSSPGLATQ
jgi:hypothetical protein